MNLELDIRVALHQSSPTLSDENLGLLNQAFDKVIVSDGIIPQIGSCILVPMDGGISCFKVAEMTILPQCYIEFEVKMSY